MAGQFTLDGAWQRVTLKLPPTTANLRHAEKLVVKVRAAVARGTFDWKDACHLCLQHPKHASFFVQKLWSYFVPVAPDSATQRDLEAIYRTRQVRPVVEAILRHPALYLGPRMTKPPAETIAKAT